VLEGGVGGGGERGAVGVCWEDVKESGRWFGAVVQIWEWRESVFTSTPAAVSKGAGRGFARPRYSVSVAGGGSKWTVNWPVRPARVILLC
jgi:hypothetical protein